MTSARRPSDVIDIRHGDALDVLRSLPDESVEAVVTDPPYGLGEEPDMAEVLTHWLAEDDYKHRGGGFMGRTWDSFVPGPAVWREACRVLKPGGHLLCFAGTRTVDLMGISIRLAGFEIRDTITWLYGSGFPKSLDVAKAIDRAGGASPDRLADLLGYSADEREVVGATTDRRSDGSVIGLGHSGVQYGEARTTEARHWEGWGTALKPASEPIIVARKPLAANVLTYGAGALNIAATRVATSPQDAAAMQRANTPGSGRMKAGGSPIGTFIRSNPTGAMDTTQGRWPSNVVLTHASDCQQVGTRKVRSQSPAVPQPDFKHVNGQVTNLDAHARNGELSQGYADEDGTETVEAWECAEGCPVAELDTQSGELTSGVLSPANNVRASGNTPMSGPNQADRVKGTFGGDTGGASRFFPTFRYQAKADGSERPSYIGPVCFSNSNCAQITDEMHPSAWPEWARDPKGVCPECDTSCGPIMHPTVKPVDLMRWLVRLVVPKIKPGDDRPPPVVVDMYAGTGSTGEAVLLEGGLDGLTQCILGDKVGAHIPLIEQRVKKYDDARALARARRGEKVRSSAKPRKAAVNDNDGHDLFADWAS